jgi:hypothetical protein
MALPEVPTRIEPALLGEASGDLLDLLTEIPAAAPRSGPGCIRAPRQALPTWCA